MQASSNQSSSAMAQILNPIDGYRGAQKARGLPPKNHMAANRQSLRKQEEVIQKRKADLENTKSKCQKIAR